MKTVLVILAGSIILSFASCRKEASRACYTCKTAISYSANGMPIPVPQIPGLVGSKDTTYCDKTQGDIDVIQKDGSNTQNFSLAGFTIVSTQTTSCIKN